MKIKRALEEVAAEAQKDGYGFEYMRNIRDGSLEMRIFKGRFGERVTLPVREVVEHIVGSTGQIFVDGIVCCHNSFAPFRVSCCAFRLGSGRFTVRPVKVSGADQMHHGAALYAAFCWAANAYKWFEVFTSAFCKFVSAVACSSHW